MSIQSDGQSSTPRIQNQDPNSKTDRVGSNGRRAGRGMNNNPQPRASSHTLIDKANLSSAFHIKLCQAAPNRHDAYNLTARRKQNRAATFQSAEQQDLAAKTLTRPDSGTLQDKQGPAQPANAQGISPTENAQKGVDATPLDFCFPVRIFQKYFSRVCFRGQWI